MARVLVLGASGFIGAHIAAAQADEALMALSLSAVVIQPSLVYGAGGASARLFTTLAALPVIPLPGDGTQEVQPIHIDDLTALVVRLVAPCADVTGRIEAVEHEVARAAIPARAEGARASGRPERDAAA